MRAAAAVMLMAAALGCETYRVEYHTRPDYYHQAAVSELNDEVTLEDGTKIVYLSREDSLAADRARRASRSARQGPRKEYQVREELDDGTIILRAMIPEHVLANLMACLANEEYELIYNELISHHTRDAWEASGKDIEDFIDYFEVHRNEMMRTVHRMQLGLPRFEAMLDRISQEMMEVRLRPHIGQGYRFTRVRIVVDGIGLKLLNIY